MFVCSWLKQALAGERACYHSMFNCGSQVLLLGTKSFQVRLKHCIYLVVLILMVLSLYLYLYSFSFTWCTFFAIITSSFLQFISSYLYSMKVSPNISSLYISDDKLSCITTPKSLRSRVCVSACDCVRSCAYIPGGDSTLMAGPPWPSGTFGTHTGGTAAGTGYLPRQSPSHCRTQTQEGEEATGRRQAGGRPVGYLWFVLMCVCVCVHVWPNLILPCSTVGSGQDQWAAESVPWCSAWHSARARQSDGTHTALHTASAAVCQGGGGGRPEGGAVWQGVGYLQWGCYL